MPPAGFAAGVFAALAAFFGAAAFVARFAGAGFAAAVADADFARVPFPDSASLCAADFFAAGLAAAFDALASAGFAALAFAARRGVFDASALEPAAALFALPRLAGLDSPAPLAACFVDARTAIACARNLT